MTIVREMLKQKFGDQLTVSVPEAGEVLGIKKAASYEAAHRGDIHVIQVGKLMRVPINFLVRKLEEAA